MAATVGSLRIELSASIAQFQEDMGKAADAVKATAAEFTKAGNDFKKIGAQMQSVGLAISKTLTLPLVGLSAAVFKVGTDFEDAFAGVRKTVSGSVADLNGISDAFRDMAKTIPTSAAELAKIGETAGQLGISKENVVAFTKTIAEIGAATNLSTEEAATSFAKLANVLNVPKDQFESLGSAVYSLGNFGAATEGEMLAMAQRIAGAGAAAGLNAPQVLGLANALASVGLDAEAGGTAMSKIIIKIAQAAHDGGKALDDFAKVAGVSSEQFKNDFQTNASGAIVEFVQGLGRIKKSGGDLLGTIQDLGFKEVRLRDATLRMAQAGDLVADSVDLGTKAFQDHSAFLGAVETRYQTTTNQLKILGNQITDVGLTLFTSLKPAIEVAIGLVQTLLPYIDSMAKAFATLPGGVQLTVIGIGAFAAALGPAIWLSGQLVSSFAQLTLAFGKGGIATRVIIGSLGLVEKALGALGSAVLVDGAVMFEWGKDTVAVGGWLGQIGGAVGTLISGGLGPLTGAFEAIGGVMAAVLSPVTLVIGGLAALGIAVAAVTGHWEDVKAGMTAILHVVADVGAALWSLGKTVIGGVIDALGGLATLVGSGIILAFEGLVAVARAVVTPFVDFGVAVNDSINNLGGLGTVLKVVGAGLLALVSPVAGVIAGIAVMIGHWDDVTGAMRAVVSVVEDLGTVLSVMASSVLGDLVTGLGALATWLGGSIASGFQGLVSLVGDVIAPLTDLATLLAGPVLSAFKNLAAFLGSNVAGWFGGLISGIGSVLSAGKDLVVNGVKDLHDYAQAVRDAAKDVEAGFQQAQKGLEAFRKSITDRAIPTAAVDIGTALALLKSQLGTLGKDSGNGFDDLTAALKAARAELTALSAHDLAALTSAVKSGAFSMKEIEDETGLSSLALKLFQGDIRDSAKELKASQSIFDDYKKKVAELTTALSEGLKFNVPTEFIKRQFGSMIQSVEDDASVLGKTVPQIINDAFLKITIKEGTDKLQKDFAKFGDDLNKQVKADMDRVNASVIKTLGVIVDSGRSTADSEAQFSIEGLKNEIANLEKVDGETAKSHALRKQLAAEEYQYQVTLIQREAQAKKDALDKTDEFYNDALDAIDQATASKMGLASQSYQQKIKEMQTSTKKWTDSLGSISSAFSSIASASGGAFAEVAKDIGSVIGAFGAATKAANDLKTATKAYQIAVDNGDIQGQYAATADKIAAVANGIASVAQATSSKNKAAAIGGGALSGGVTGAAIGSIVPGIGTAIGFGVGATVGALVGLFRSIHQGPAEKAANDVGRDFGVNISDSLAKELGDLRGTIGQQAADVFDLDKIIAEGGGLRSDNIDKYTKKLRDTFSLVQTGALTAADGANVLEKNFANFANEFLANGPLISKDLVEIVRLTDNLGASSKAVGDFIKQQVATNILPGLQAFTTASKTASDALAENQQKLHDLNQQLTESSDPSEQADLRKQIDDVTAAMLKQQGVVAATAVTSEGAADALSASVAVAFAEMMKAGTPILDIVNQLEPIVESLGQQFAAAGFSGGAAFQNIQKLVGVAADEIAGPAIQAATGLGQALAGLSNIGQLDQGTFTGLTDQIAATFNSLVAQGQDGASVLALMQGPLQTIWQLSTEFGYSVDDSTKALLDQAIAAGEVGEKFKDPQQQMIDALSQTNTILGSIAKALGATLPEAAKAGAAGVKDAFADVNPKVNVDIEYHDPGYTPPDVSTAATGGLVTPFGVQHFAAGGLVNGFRPRGTDTVPAMLTPGEVVLNRSQQAGVFSAMAGGLSGRESAASEADLAESPRSGRAQMPASGGDVHVSFTIQAMDGPSVRDHVTRPGGIADLVIDSVSQGKRGRDERLRRGLALKS